MDNKFIIGIKNIHEKFKDNGFINIDFFRLFGISDISINLMNKKVSSRYHQLILKYHPDKLQGRDEKYIIIRDIKNNFEVKIDTDEIRNGSFFNYITDIYNLLTTTLDENPQLILDGIDMNILAIDNIDHNTLKLSYLNNNLSLQKPTDEQLEAIHKELELLKIKESKLTSEILEELILKEESKRESLEIKNIFNKLDVEKEEFNEKFTQIHEEEMNLRPELETREIQPYKADQDMMLSSFNNSTISDINEAFEPIVYRKSNNMYRNMSYDEILEERSKQDKLFKK
jgi:hypothetical protein